MDKIKKTIYIAFFVSLAAQIHVNFFINGFIIALSVIVLAIFLYCYEDLSPLYITMCAAIFSPLFRMILLVVSGNQWVETFKLVLPDAVFFIAYGITLFNIYKLPVVGKKSIKNFPVIITICDVVANITELMARSIINDTWILSFPIIIELIIIAVVRTILIQVILIAMETYSSLLIKQEHDEEYKKLIVLASILENELYIMDKNANEIEDIMKQAFELYKKMEQIKAPRELIESSLDISKNAHEIKGDYLSIIGILKNSFVTEYENNEISIKDILNIIKTDLVNYIYSHNLNIEISVRIKANFLVKKHFKMMSIIRNLAINAIEAINQDKGKIIILVEQDHENYIISVEDNGPGIKTSNLSSIYFHGFSTKFSEETGNVQRGVGLAVVKDYVENIFEGEIRVESRENKGTKFEILLPRSAFGEKEI
ncbi:MAG: sensor histidine kinase [Eubacteriales bacterium]|nr:sensor histidine kinase [Eubacteriales bacterium]